MNIFSYINFLSRNIQKKIKNSRMYHYSKPYISPISKQSLVNYLHQNNEAKNNLFKDLDLESQDIINRMIELILMSPNKDDIKGIKWKYLHILSEKDHDIIKNYYKTLPQVWRKYHIGKCHSETDFFFHYGLMYLQKSVNEYLKNGVFIDAGAYDGSTTLMMHDYNPNKIFSFEISPRSINKMNKFFNKINISKKFEIVQKGLGDINETIYFNDTGTPGTNLNKKGETAAEVVSLDSFLNDKQDLNIKWIKADVEGAALKLIKGAELCIKKNRPIITIGVYHSTEELFEIKPLIESWNLNYKFIFRKTSIHYARMLTTEICLIAYPKELTNKI